MIFTTSSTKLVHICRRYLHGTRKLQSALHNSPNAAIDKNIYDRYMCLPTPESKVQVTYIWIDGSGQHLRSKSRVLDSVPNTYKDAPNWTYNGVNTNQATPQKPDCHLIPIAMYNDPIRRGKNKLILCETYDADERPTKTNHRQACVDALNKVCDLDVEVGFEQEYFLMARNGFPFGWPENGEPSAKCHTYCCVGACNVFGREIVECFYRCCLYCGIDLHSEKAEIVPAQWEFKTGPTKSIKAADDIWVARWLLKRVAEDYGVGISFHPKLLPNWGGSGLHMTFSTKRTRDKDGLKHLEEAIKKLEKAHKDHMKVYDPKGGEYNKARLTGQFFSSEFDKFTHGIGTRAVSVRIPKSVVHKKKGFLEDRRPAANADPYSVLNAVIRTCII